MEVADLLNELNPRRGPSCDVGDHWHKAMRVIMSVSPTANDSADWESADLDAGDSPVTTEEWQAWLRTEPTHILWALRGLLEFEGERDGVPSYQEVLRFLIEEVPSAVKGFASPHTNPVRHEIDGKFGAALGELSGSVNWEMAAQPVLGGWFRAQVAAERKFTPYELRKLHDLFSVLEPPLSELYPRVALATTKKVRKGDVTDISVNAAWCTTDELVAILKAVKGKRANAHALCSQLVEQGEPSGLQAIAHFLADTKIGDLAAFWIAIAGYQGRAAANEVWSGKKGAKAKKVFAALDGIAQHGDARPAFSGTRHRHPGSLASWWGETPTGQGGAPALTRDGAIALRATQMAGEIGELSQEQWADWFQIISFDAHQAHPGRSWNQANELGVLGDPTLLLAAAERMECARASYLSAEKFGYGDILLNAGVDAQTYVGCAARLLQNSALRNTMGWVENHLIRPLERATPDWADSVQDWLSALRGPLPHVSIPTPARGAAAEGDVSWDTSASDLHASIPPAGVARIECGDEAIVIDLEAQTITLSGSRSAVLRMPVAPRGLPLTLVRAGEELTLVLGGVAWGKLAGFVGTATASGLTGVGFGPADNPIWRSLTHLLGAERPAAVGWLVDFETSEAARALGLVAELLPDVLPEAVASGLAAMGSLGARYTAVLADSVNDGPPVRSFETVSAALENPRTHGDWTVSGPVGLGFTGPAVLCVETALSATDLQTLVLESGLVLEGDSMELATWEGAGLTRVVWTQDFPNGGFGNGPLFSRIHVMTWPVEDGHAVAVWDSFEFERAHLLAGVPYLPTARWTPVS